MRKNIFDIVQSNNSLSVESERIVVLFEEEDIISFGDRIYTLKECVDDFYFSDWMNRNHCINVDDYLDALNYGRLTNRAERNVEDFLTLIELVYNFWYLPYNDLINPDDRLNAYDNYYHLQKIMDDCLNEYNHVAYIDKENERVYVVEDKPEVTAVAEIVDETLSLSVIKYNHHSLKGEINTKKAILALLSAELEPRRKELYQINKKLSDNVFFLLNNINIRHNNTSKGDKNYNEYIAKINDTELEQLYDELYQMMLLSLLLLDNAKRENDIDIIRNKINGGK